LSDTKNLLPNSFPGLSKGLALSGLELEGFVLQFYVNMREVVKVTV